MLIKPKHHILVCVNDRGEDHPLGCCLKRGGEELALEFKRKVREKGWSEVYVTRTRCLGPCQYGANVVVYPDAEWYCNVKLDDVDEILESHVERGEAVVRLRNPQYIDRSD